MLGTGIYLAPGNRRFDADREGGWTLQRQTSVIDPYPGLCKHSHMATNLAIDERLLEEALRAGGHRTKKATVNEALAEYIRRRKQGDIVALFGKLDIDPDYDHKAQRRKR
jgi:hypothetical protein